jgi:hypothetical protein
MYIHYFCSVVLLSLCFILLSTLFPFHSILFLAPILYSHLHKIIFSIIYSLILYSPSSLYCHLLFTFCSLFFFLFFYQDKKDHTHSIGCSTALHPTSEFIKGHIDRYIDWSPYKGMIPVNSEIIVITLCSLFILFLLSVFTCLRWQYIKSILQPWNCFHKKGYTGISDSPEHNIENSSIQMS